jgi:uncharacterized protein with HEPN domain
VYLRDILDATTKLKELIQGMDYESFQEDWRTYHTAFSLLEIIGEASGRITAEFQAQNPTIPWVNMKAMRKALIHGYANVELDVVWNTLTHDIPPLHQQITSLLRSAVPEARQPDERER